MPASNADLADAGDRVAALTELPFPPLTTSHILHCSYHVWHARYRALSPKARLIEVNQAFLEYLRADGILLPDITDQKNEAEVSWSTDQSDGEDEDLNPIEGWEVIHQKIKSTIDELGGKVVPKLNWSAPKDATWINATNSMDCYNANDIYLLLKSSDFITHDLEHAFDGCMDDNATQAEKSAIPFHLVLRKHVQFNTSVEFRCFVRERRLIGVCQRDNNHYPFLQGLRPKLLDQILRFFIENVRDSFPDPNYTFDVYVPAPHNRVWLIDFNPWAVRTDPLLYSWLELLTMRDPIDPEDEKTLEEDFVRITFGSQAEVLSSDEEMDNNRSNHVPLVEARDEEEIIPELELRLIEKDDPEAYSFSTPQYSAHKLPRDVVDASLSGPGPMAQLATQWREALAKRHQESDSDSG